MTQHRVCDQCPGLKLVTETEEIELEIEPGMVDGMVQKFSGSQIIAASALCALFELLVCLV